MKTGTCCSWEGYYRFAGTLLSSWILDHSRIREAGRAGDTLSGQVLGLVDERSNTRDTLNVQPVAIGRWYTFNCVCIAQIFNRRRCPKHETQMREAHHDEISYTCSKMREGDRAR